MSVAIETDDVLEVMVGGVWLKVEDETFDCDAYEYIHRADPGDMDCIIVGAGDGKTVPTTGFTFVEQGSEFRVCGPLSAIQAVRVAR
jgi:hypothetical protein